MLVPYFCAYNPQVIFFCVRKSIGAGYIRMRVIHENITQTIAYEPYKSNLIGALMKHKKAMSDSAGTLLTLY